MNKTNNKKVNTQLPTNPSSSFVSSRKMDVLQEYQEISDIKKAKTHCRKITIGITNSLNINGYDTGLVYLIGKDNAKNNAEAIAGWIYGINPNINCSDIDTVYEYQKLLCHQLSKHGLYCD
jgi:hypothetical protein